MNVTGKYEIADLPTHRQGQKLNNTESIYQELEWINHSAITMQTKETHLKILTRISLVSFLMQQKKRADHIDED